MPTALLSDADRLALSRFPATISQSDLFRYFRLSQQDLDRVAQFRTPANRLGFALQLCTLRYLGFVPNDLALTPIVVVEYLARQLHTTPEQLHHYGQRAQTHRAHRLTIIRYLGFQSPTTAALDRLKHWLTQRALEHDKPTLLLELALQKLYAEQIVRPALSTLERLVMESRAQANRITFERLQPLLSEARCTFFDRLLEVDDTLGMTPLSWLRRPATTNSPVAIRKTLLKLHFLDQQDVANWSLNVIHPNRLKFLAQLGKRSSARSLQRTAPPKRYAILVAFIAQLRSEILDEVIDLFCQCLSETFARARHDRQQAHLQAAVALNEKVRLLGEIGTLILDEVIADDKLRSRIFQQVPQPLLVEAVADCQRLLRPTPDHAIDFFVTRYSYLRQFIPSFLETLQFQAQIEPHPLLAALHLLHQLNERHQRAIPADAPIQAVPPSWQDLLFDAAMQIQRRYYELGILWQLRSALRSGEVFLPGSRRYAPLDADLIPPKLWPTLRSEFSQLIPCPLDPKPRLHQLQQEFAHQLELFQQTLQHADTVRLEDDRLILSPLTAQSRPPEITSLQNRLSLLLPPVQLPDLLIEVDQAIGFSHHFSHAAGDSTPEPDAPIYLYAVILAQACNIGFQAMARAADLSFDRLLWFAHWFLRDETLQPVIDAIVNFHHKLPLAQHWGSGILSSSDGQRFPVAVKNRQAVPLPRYFGYG